MWWGEDEDNPDELVLYLGWAGSLGGSGLRHALELRLGQPGRIWVPNGVMDDSYLQLDTSRIHIRLSASGSTEGSRTFGHRLHPNFSRGNAD